MRGGGTRYPEGLEQLGIRFTVPVLARVDREVARRRKATGLPLTRSDVIRDLVRERLDEIDSPRPIRKVRDQQEGDRLQSQKTGDR